jgi:ferredoxin-NADP reductase
MISFRALLTNKVEVAPGVFFLTFKDRSGSPFVFKAGQYVIVTIPKEQGCVKRLYSVASSPLDTLCFSLLVKRVDGGVGSSFLSALLPGEEVDMSGPAGLFSFQETPLHKVFLTTGTGLAPVLSIASSYTGFPMSLFWGVQTMKVVYFLDFFRKTRESSPLFDYHICLSREELKVQNGFLFSGRINEAMEFYMGSFFKSTGRNSCEYYICGSRTVVESLREQLFSLGVEKNHIFFEKY